MSREAIFDYLYLSIRPEISNIGYRPLQFSTFLYLVLHGSISVQRVYLDHLWSTTFPVAFSWSPFYLSSFCLALQMAKFIWLLLCDLRHLLFLLYFLVIHFSSFLIAVQLLYSTYYIQQLDKKHCMLNNGPFHWSLGLSYFVYIYLCKCTGMSCVSLIWLNYCPILFRLIYFQHSHLSIYNSLSQQEIP